MSDAWKQWEGQVVNGKFPLLRYLGASEHSAVFLTERHDGDRLLRAAIKLMPAGGENDEFQLSRWRLASELSHPHLIALFESGRCELGNVQLLYILMEYAEESLAQVLPDRALTAAETQAMLDPLLDVLSYLHGKGFVHGRIKPANILANDDDLKVASDGVRPEGDPPDNFGSSGAYDPPENARAIFPVVGTLSPARDIWSLGIMLVEILTQNLPTMRATEQQDPLLPETLPEPFFDIARHCLVWHPQGRWTVAQIVARLRDPAPSPQAAPPVRPPPSTARSVQPSTKRHSYAGVIVVGLMLAAVFAGARLLRQHSEVPQPVVVALEPRTIQPGPTRAAEAPPAPQERPTGRFELRPAEKWQSATKTLPAPLPASAHPQIAFDRETLRNEKPNAIATRPADAVIQGEVVHKVLPDVPESARNTIRGTLRVIVHVDVDRFGSVDVADLKLPGPSKYFARQALQAAQLWKFKPPQVAGQGVSSSWTLRFEFTQNGTTVTPTQEIP